MTLISRPPNQRQPCWGFWSHKGGATAIEFGLVGLPFVLLLLVILEASLLLTAQLTFNNAVDRGARQVLTGNFQEKSDGTDPAVRLRKSICEGFVMFSCADLKVEVTTSPTYRTPSATNPYDADKKAMAEGFGNRFDCPNGDEIVSIRAATTVSAYLPMVDFTGSKIGTDKQLILATAVFRSEPFGPGRCQ
ncbi:MAG: pilus assembly protein [Methylobacterium sp.]|uniref:TadE/TadG family type IV pilus assembly protein n=1 Tax=Methylobacterium sp. TaxID=409 RepID=UPI0025DEDFB1|nr:TadE/TadG family type IV pilus assembly protein [Methylobacterium sp.]MBX9933230.1 pilus assembly protein [Methylobacterium sp.]